jgi:chromosome partitioning protein
MKIVAVYNIKGGVGKTTTSVNLAALAAASGTRVLVWDLDPQGAATFFFRVAPKVKGGQRALVGKAADLDALIKGTDYPCLDLLPADFSYRKLDLLLGRKKKSIKRLTSAVAALHENYDLVLIDCPPGISAVSEALFQLADALLVPVIPTTLSVRTLETVAAFLSKQRYAVPRLYPFFSMLDRRKSLHREITERLWDAVPAFLRTAIPNAAVIERMGIRRAPLVAFAPGSEAAAAYQALWRELAARLGWAPAELTEAAARGVDMKRPMGAL